MRKVNLVTTYDLLRHAETIGYKHNDAHRFLFEIDNVGPCYEIHSCDYTLGDFDLTARKPSQHYSYDTIEYHPDTVKIMLSFMNTNKVKKITVVLD